MKNIHSYSRIPLIFIALFGAVSDARASDTGDQVLDEVVVTATRKEESLQDVPLSVAAISGKAIEMSGSTVFGDIGFSVANFMTETSGHNPLIGNVTIRGISGRAGVYLDDVIVGSTAAYNGALMDVERIEVLRGPQGTTFGANTLAGAVNTITRPPSLTDLRGEVNATIGEYGTRNFRGFITAPVAEGLGMKLSGFSSKQHGPDSDASGKHYNGNDETGFRVSALYSPTKDFSLLIAYDHSRLNLKNAFVPQLYSAPAGSIADTLIRANMLPDFRRPADRRVFGTTDANILNRDVDGLSARIDWNVGEVKLTSITAYRQVKAFSHKDEEYLPIYLAFSDTAQNQKQVTQEFRVNGQIANFEYIGGLFYFKNKNADSSTIPISGEYLNLVGLTPGLFTMFGLPESYSTNGAIFQANSDLRKTESFAAFGSANLHVTEALTVTLGGRFTKEKVQGSSGMAGSNLPPALSFLPGFVYGTQSRPASIPMLRLPSIRSSRFDPAASISFAVSPSVNLFVSAGSGYKSPGYNSLSNCSAPTLNAPCVVRREMGRSFEAGIKSEWFEHRLRLNLVAYQLKLQDAQLYQTVPQAVGPYLSRIVNSDETSKGVELEFVAKPFPGLTIEGSLGYQDATYDSYPNAYILFDRGGSAPAYCYAATIDTGNGYCIGDATGKTIPFAPKYTGGIAATYEGKISPAIDWFIRGEAQRRGKYGFQLGTAAVTRVDTIDLVNLSAGISEPDGKGFALTLRGRNITNARYFTNAANVPTGETYVNLNDPRTLAVEIAYRF